MERAADIDITISQKNSKMGDIPSFSLPAGLSCPAGVPCAEKCYARKGRQKFDSVRESYRRNLRAVKTDPEKTAETIIQWLRERRNTCHVFRWNVSGDFATPGYADMAFRVARETPWVTHFAYTKVYALLTRKDVPENFRLIASVWGVYRPHIDGGKIIRAYMRDKAGKHYIPASTPERPVYNCTCKMQCMGCTRPCWKMQPGEAVVFDEH